ARRSPSAARAAEGASAGVRRGATCGTKPSVDSPPMRGVRHAVVVAAVALPAVAAAEEATDPRASARHAIADGDLSRARELLRAAPPDASSAERAATAELLYVVDLWAARGRPPS